MIRLKKEIIFCKLYDLCEYSGLCNGISRETEVKEGKIVSKIECAYRERLCGRR